jgi:cellulose synthase/poly-beta-1,6-N-acetylglucosamine synthase-like glycosyltransferase
LKQQKFSGNKRQSFLWPLFVICGQLLSGLRAGRNYQSLPEVLPTSQQDPPANAWPGISVIVPARNEAHNLPRLLASLVEQVYPIFEVIIVDDASTDGTAEIVQRYKTHGVRLLHSDGPPSGWTGKNAACWRGAKASIHPWLLFVDADTTLAPSALRSSIIFALEREVLALSLFTQQRCETFWERLLLPFAYQQYFVGVHAKRIHAQRGPALANGQYFLMHRDAYKQAGGHAANKQSIIDDVALATRLKKVGIVPLACRGEQLVSVRMYTGLLTIIAGFGKNSYLFLRQFPLTGLQTAASTTLAASIVPLCLNAVRLKSQRLAVCALLAYFTQVLCMRSWLRRFHVSWPYALLAPFAAIGFLAIAIKSMLQTMLGRTQTWKGRSYHFSRVRYRLPRRWIMEMGRALLFNTPRSIIEDSRLAVDALPKPPQVVGEKHIPREGSFVLVSNHYQRLDLWIGWSGALLIDILARHRDIDMHYVTTDRARIGTWTVPGTRWLIERVASVWGLVLVTPPAIANEHNDGQRYALLRMLRLLKRKSDRSICIGLMPEGDEGNTQGLIEALPGTGRALYALSRQAIPILPAAVWEEDGRLHARFGEPFALASSYEPFQKKNAQLLDAWARDTVMRQIAVLLPDTLRGTYAMMENIRHGTLD